MSGKLGVTRVLHVAINTSADPAAVRSFWEPLVGAPVARPEIPGVDGVWFADAQLHLVETEGTGPLAHHWCLGVESLPAAKAELEAAGIPYLTGVQTWPDGTAVDQLWFTDPTGQTVELQEDAQASAT